jgi:AGZA family xanthine/uracil permease-like MFS transporter
MTREFKGAATTFLATAYILAVNPRIMADSGGPCVAPEGNIFAPEYEQCLEDIRRQFVTATAIASMFGCIAMGLMANLPIALSAGMGMNAYFTYGVVGWRGTGSVSYEAAVTAVLIEGFIFLILALTGVRYFIIKFVPEPVRIATPAGIGAFLAHLGLQTAEGLGVVVGDVATAVTLGGCAPEDRIPLVAYDEDCATLGICIISDNYTCDPNKPMRSATVWLGIVGLFITAAMLSYR